MRENLHRFFRAARGAGVRVSPAESIDAMRAVANVGFADRGILRDTFLLTLAKTQDEKNALGDCFDLFFSQPEPARSPPEDGKTEEPEQTGIQRRIRFARDAGGGDEKAEGLGPLAQMLLSQDRNAMAAAIANASSAASLSDIRYFTQRGIFSGRILDPMGIQRLRDDLDNLTATNPALAERLQAALDGLRDTVRDTVSQALMLYGREEAENLRNEILRNAPLSRIEPRQVEQMRRADPPDRAPPARALLQAAQAPAPRPSRRAPHHPKERRLGRHSVPHRLEAPASRPAQDRGAVRRLGFGRPGLGFLPAADPQPARGGGRRPLVCLLRPSDRGQRHPGIQIAGRGDGRDHVQGRLRLVRLRQLASTISRTAG